jgi:hypothetical protein
VSSWDSKVELGEELGLPRRPQWGAGFTGTGRPRFSAGKAY